MTPSAVWIGGPAGTGKTSMARALSRLLSQCARLEARGGMTETSDPVRARANAVERDLLIGRLFEREAKELGLPTLAVDRPLDEMIGLAQAVLAPAIERRPRDVDLSAIRRQENRAIHEQVTLYRASGEARPEHLEGAIPFSCECGRSGCDAVVELTLADFAACERVDGHRGVRLP